MWGVWAWAADRRKWLTRRASNSASILGLVTESTEGVSINKHRTLQWGTDDKFSMDIGPTSPSSLVKVPRASTSSTVMLTDDDGIFSGVARL